MADADLLPDLGMLVARTRDLNRNNGVAAGAFQSLQDNTVGIGLRLACAPDYRALGKSIQWAEDWSRNVESLWRTWADSPFCDAAGRLNFHSQTQQVFRSTLENGEALCLPLWMERSGTPFRTCLQLIDSDRLSNPHYEVPTLTLRGGVEMDDYGKPLAYYIRKIANWPFLWADANFGSWEWERVPAETPFGRKRVLHLYVEDRPDQTRGKPLLSPVIEQFRQLDSYQRTELQSAIVNSLVAGIIETPLDPAGINELMGGDPNKYLAAKGDYRIQLEGGTFIPLYPGDKMTPFTPSRPAPQFSNFVEAVARQIGVAVGLPYELVMKDFSKTNYSSARAALLEAWRFFINRRTWLANYWASPVYQLWLEEAVNAGMVDAPNFYEQAPYYLKCKWIGPGRGWIDPVKEAEAAQIRMASMISTLEMECAEQGMDWNDVLDQRALEVARLKELDLYQPPPPPTKPTGTPAAPEDTPVREPV
jgi:lambda family phage portal protein